MASDSTTSQPPPHSLMDLVIQITIPVSTKLDRQNFLTWKSQIEPIIDDFGLSRFLSPPDKNILIVGVSHSNPAYLAWYKQDRFLLGWLRSSISEGVLSQYVTCQSARDLWISLHQLYSAVSTARVMDLRHALQTTTRGSQSCGSFFEKMRSIADQLASAGEPVPDSNLVRSILSGLGSEYNSFVVAITTRSASISLIELHSFLLSHERLLFSQTPSSISNGSDLVALHASSGRGRGRVEGEEGLTRARPQ